MTEPTAPDLDQIRAQVAEMRQANDANLKALKAQGVGVDVGMVRLLVLLDLSLGPADGEHVTPMRLKYELAVQRTFTELIANAQSEVARRTLLAGVNGNRADRRRAARGDNHG